MHFATSIILQYINTRTRRFQFTFLFPQPFVQTSNVQIQPPSCLVRVGPHTPSLIQIGNYVAPRAQLRSRSDCRASPSAARSVQYRHLLVPVPLASALLSPDARVYIFRSQSSSFLCRSSDSRASQLCLSFSCSPGTSQSRHSWPRHFTVPTPSDHRSSDQFLISTQFLVLCTSPLDAAITTIQFFHSIPLSSRIRTRLVTVLVR